MKLQVIKPTIKFFGECIPHVKDLYDRLRWVKKVGKDAGSAYDLGGTLVSLQTNSPIFYCSASLAYRVR